MDSHQHIEDLRRRAEEYLQRVKPALDDDAYADVQSLLHELLAHTASTDLFEKTFASQLDALFILDANRPPTIINCNPAATAVFGYTYQEMVGRTTAFLHVNQTTLRQFQNHVYPIIEEDGFLHLAEFEMKRKDGTIFPTEHSVVPVKDEHGKHIGWVSVVRDITARKQMENDLRERERKYHLLFENMAQGAFYQRADGVITDVNPAVLEMFGLTREQFLGRTSTHPSWKVIHEDGSDFPGEEHPSMVALKTGNPVRDKVAGVFNPRKNDYLWLSINAIPQFKPGEEQPYQVFVTFHDITARKQMEEKLRASEARYRSLFESAQEAIVTSTPDGRITAANPAAVRMAGCASLEEFLRTPALKFYPDPAQRTALLKELREKGHVTGYEITVKKKDGTLVEALGSVVLHTDEAGNIWIETIFRDITKRKQEHRKLAAATQQLQTVIETVGEGITLSDERGYFAIFNSKMEEITGYTHDEANRAEDFLALLYPDPFWYQQTMSGIQELEQQGGERNIETVIRAKDGSRKTLLVSTSIIERDGTRYFLSAYRDITALKQIERQLEHETQTKTELLREVNHRVGNNLTAIAGLLSLERRHLKTAAQSAYQSILEDLTNRVNSLARVHGMLSSSEWQPLQLDELCQQVIDSSLQICPYHKHIAVQVAPSPVRVTAKQAHHLALIINELATNTVKYALRDRETAQITVQITQAEDTIRIVFQDDGPGYPDAILRGEHHNVGLDVVRHLTRRDLRGACSLRSAAGAVTVIRFPNETDSN